MCKRKNLTTATWFVQTKPVEPPSSTLVVEPPSNTPEDSPVSASFSHTPTDSPVSTPVGALRSSVPDDSSSTVSIWGKRVRSNLVSRVALAKHSCVVVVVIAIVAFIALVLAIAFGVKYVQMKKLVGDEDRARLLPFTTKKTC
jgi:hypothetical protein